MLPRLLIAFRKYQRAKRISRYRNALPPYVLKEFEKELNYKLWSTKGARFATSHRTEILQRLSGQCVVYLSAYLIVAGLVNVYGLSFWLITLTDAQVNFASISLSVMILLFSQLETEENFVLKSHRYHDCALYIAELYNELCYAKSYEDNDPNKKAIFRYIS